MLWKSRPPAFSHGPEKVDRAMDAGEILCQQGLLDRLQLDQCRATCPPGESLLQWVVQQGKVAEDEALQSVGSAMGMDYIDLARTDDIDLSLLQSFPQRIIYKDTVFPIRRVNGSLIVATSDPFDLEPLDEVSATVGLSVIPVLASRQELARVIKRHMGVGSETVDGLMAQADDEPVELLGEIESDGSELSEMAQEASVIRLVNEILIEAIEARSSDVHIESQADGLVVRYRIDGMLQLQPMPAEIHRFHAAIISRLKIMARLNIAEKRLPQDGRIKLRVAGREIDVRVSVIPMIHGESIVMRILDKGAMKFQLASLGMSEEVYKTFRELIDIPHGIVLVTGPTGSGKTTTLYSALEEIRSPEVKIITTEDPVEYQLPGINQIQVHPKIGLTFAQSLRAILRHDPDVVLIGEIRDLETAENAIQASLTGHLVFSTLHTNDASSAYTRLVDMGVEPFLVASTVEAVMAQRLIRRLCKECREPYQPGREDLPKDFPWERLQEQGGSLMRPVGCRKCRQQGYSGRSGIYELLVNSEKIRELANARRSSWDIRVQAEKEGMRTLRMDGWRKVLLGESSVDEVARVTKGDRL